MGKRGGAKRVLNTQSGFQNRISLREEITGKKQTKGGGVVGGSTKVKSILRNKHLQNLAVWATEASIPSLGAFFGHRLAADGEAEGIAPDPNLFACQRCETILQPGFNCTVRIEKNLAKAQRHRSKKSNTSSTQNNVVYKCHFCSHQNLKRGTPKGHMKEIYPTKPKTTSISKPAKSTLQKCVNSEKDLREVPKVDETALPAIAGDTPVTQNPATPLLRPATSLLDRNRRKRNRSGTRKPAETEGSSAATDTEKAVCASSKRRRKSWTSLKEIAKSNGHDNSPNTTNLKIPFCL